MYTVFKPCNNCLQSSLEMLGVFHGATFYEKKKLGHWENVLHICLWTHILLFMLLSSAADDPTDYVSALCLGSVQQRHDRVLLVRNTIQGTSMFYLIFHRNIRTYEIACFYDTDRHHVMIAPHNICYLNVKIILIVTFSVS